ncbi:hypothetical protein ACIQKE_32165 [Streptomyces griseoviridis]|uniref:Uncharacterized protein n=1 Tax=Streptomyces hintoniae TaxID=3075521 RepID=A0ABU2UMM0_9ACTN|nr:MULTISPECIES: hypothetical protein [Streptomyces]MDH6699335.1 hypothetical protein [Streptomyces sp. MAA16]MDT0474527.1 hypothetical protein [Streptomyces sp. DSM 41014]
MFCSRLPSAGPVAIGKKTQHREQSALPYRLEPWWDAREPGPVRDGSGLGRAGGRAAQA